METTIQDNLTIELNEAKNFVGKYIIEVSDINFYEGALTVDEQEVVFSLKVEAELEELEIESGVSEDAEIVNGVLLVTIIDGDDYADADIANIIATLDAVLEIEVEGQPDNTHSDEWEGSIELEKVRPYIDELEFDDIQLYEMIDTAKEQADLAIERPPEYFENSNGEVVIPDSVKRWCLEYIARLDEKRALGEVERVIDGAESVSWEEAGLDLIWPFKKHIGL